MVKSLSPKDIDVIILCGGKGERIHLFISDRPKPMAEFGGRPFLSMLVEYASSFAFTRFILCTGYLSAVIEEYYRKKPKGLEVICCHERQSLGTGGAIKGAKRLIRSNPFLVLNGDSFARVDLAKFLNFHLSKKALVSVALVKSRGSRNSGKVVLDADQRILRFDEKNTSGSNTFDNVGMYFMDCAIFSMMKKKKKISFEYDLFPKLTKKDFFGFKQGGRLIDFGTPQTYQEAKRIFAKGRLIK